MLREGMKMLVLWVDEGEGEGEEGHERGLESP